MVRGPGVPYNRGMRTRVLTSLSLVAFVGCFRADVPDPSTPAVVVASPAAVAAAPPMAPAAPLAPAPVMATTPTMVPFQAAGGGGACNAVPPGVEDLSALLEPVRQRHNLPALGAAVVTPDTIKAIGVAGVRKYGDPTPACVDDTFMLASNTKAMTAVVLAKLVEQGRLTWTTTIGEVFADIPGRNHAYDSVTLDQLLAHRGGFAHNPKSVSMAQLHALGGSLRDQREQYARIVLAEAPVNTPGTAFEYSNTGYTIAGIMGERRAGQTWENLVTSILFQPLGMAGAGFGPTATVGRVDGLWPHQMNGAPTPLEPDLSSISPLFRTPCGNVHVPMSAWARFLVEEMRSLEGRGGLLAPATYQHIHTATFGGTYASGWRVVDKKWSGTAYLHTGTDGHNFSVAWLVPKLKVGIVVGTNVGGKGVADGVADAVVTIRQRIPGAGGAVSDPQEPSEPE
jgi:CubicO group peptidase (beta-lactamase class C family)